jgi:hypothetical protein
MKIRVLHRPIGPATMRAACTGGGHHAPGASGVVVHGDSPVDNVWRRWWVKLNLEEGEAPSVVREVEAHCRGGATWGRRGAAAQRDFRAAAPRWYNSMRRKKGSLDSEQSTREWSVNGAHWRGKLSDGGGSDSSVGGGSLMVGMDKRSSGVWGCHLLLWRGSKWRGKLMHVTGEELDGRGTSGF